MIIKFCDHFVECGFVVVDLPFVSFIVLCLDSRYSRYVLYL